MKLKEQKRVFYLLLPLFLVSCGGSSGDEPTPPEPPVVTHGSISITPSASTTLPALEYRFYNTDGKTACDVRSCDGKGNFSDKLLLGDYRVIAVNKNAQGVTFKDMENHAGASVHLSPVTASRSEGYTMVSQPGVVYSVVISELTVAASDNKAQTPAPKQLTQTLNLPFTLNNGLGAEVTSITGTLHGVYPSINLFTGTPVSAVSDCEGIAVGFEATGSGTERTAAINMFGICDPKGGEAYTNTLSFTLTLADGSAEELTVDLTDALTEALAGGSLPSDIEFPVEVSRTSIGLGATVGDWTIGGESEKEM